MKMGKRNLVKEGRSWVGRRGRVLNNQAVLLCVATPQDYCKFHVMQMYANKIKNFKKQFTMFA